jgi:hypothetical protein
LGRKGGGPLFFAERGVGPFLIFKAIFLDFFFFLLNKVLDERVGGVSSFFRRKGGGLPLNFYPVRPMDPSKGFWDPENNVFRNF